MVFHLSVSEDLLSTVPSTGTKRYTCAMEKDIGTYTQSTKLNRSIPCNVFQGTKGVYKPSMN